MASTTVRISQESVKLLRDLASQENKSMQAILDQALEHYRRKSFLEKANQAYERLKQDPDLWQKELDERSQWEGTLMDGNEE